MKSALVLSALASTAVAFPLHAKREVPQEHSHEKFLTVVRSFLQKNNPDGIVDPVFGLLGNAAAKAGLGKLTDTECLQTATADRAFTNAKALKSIDGMVGALTFRALERNTGKVGLQSNSCTSFIPVNPQIAAIKQHQDPASDGAAAINKAIELELAKQIAAIGGDPSIALESATFAPGSKTDNTGKGNTCDDQNDPEGCALSRKLTVPQASAADISAAVAGSSSSGSSGNKSGSAAPAESDPDEFDDDSGDDTDADACPADASSSPAATGSTATSNAGASKALSFGSASCSDPAIAFGPGFNGRKANEFTFQPDDPAVFKHGEALNPGIIAQFICDRLNDQCKAPASTVSACRAAQAKINGRKNDPTAATDFNNALGATASKIGISAGPASTSSSASTPSSTVNPSTSSSSSGSGSGSSAKFGSCSNPAINFAPASDRGGVNAFQTANQADFNHGSAQNIGVLTAFVCQQLHDKCKATSDVLAACSVGAKNAAALKGAQAAAAFNQALGL